MDRHIQSIPLSEPEDPRVTLDTQEDPEGMWIRDKEAHPGSWSFDTFISASEDKTYIRDKYVNCIAAAIWMAVNIPMAATRSFPRQGFHSR